MAVVIAGSNEFYVRRSPRDRTDRPCSLLFGELAESIDETT